jgi:hypothetical protein
MGADGTCDLNFDASAIHQQCWSYLLRAMHLLICEANAYSC